MEDEMRWLFTVHYSPRNGRLVMMFPQMIIFEELFTPDIQDLKNELFNKDRLLCVAQNYVGDTLRSISINDTMRFKNQWKMILDAIQMLFNDLKILKLNLNDVHLDNFCWDEQTNRIYAIDQVPSVECAPDSRMFIEMLLQLGNHLGEVQSEYLEHLKTIFPEVSVEIDGMNPDEIFETQSPSTVSESTKIVYRKKVLEKRKLQSGKESTKVRKQSQSDVIVAEKELTILGDGEDKIKMNENAVDIPEGNILVKIEKNETVNEVIMNHGNDDLPFKMENHDPPIKFEISLEDKKKDVINVIQTLCMNVQGIPQLQDIETLSFDEFHDPNFLGRIARSLQEIDQVSLVHKFYCDNYREYVFSIVFEHIGENGIQELWKIYRSHEPYNSNTAMGYVRRGKVVRWLNTCDGKKSIKMFYFICGGENRRQKFHQNVEATGAQIFKTGMKFSK